jgi:hypothetical protein
MVWDRTWTEHGMPVVCWSGFPCRVYIDLNHHDSQISELLVCNNHHVDNLTNLMSLSIIDVCFLIHLIVCNSCMIRAGCTFLLK